MGKRVAIERTNQQEIGELKEALGQLNTNIAVMAEALKSLKEWIERDSTMHSDARRTLESRITSAETKIDSLELDKAKDTYLKERLGEVEKLTKALNERSSDRIAWTAGAKWTAGVFTMVSVPCIGYVLEAILKKVFGI